MTECKSGCGSEAVTRGYCRPHYESARRKGLLAKIKRSSVCAVVGCDADWYCKDFCKKHYHRSHRTGTTQLKPARVAQTGKLPIPPLVAASVQRAAIKETRRKRLAKRGIVPCAF